MKEVINIYRAIPAHMADLMTFRAMPTAKIDHLDPFLFINHHGPQVYKPNNNGLPFGPHPHRGFETLTFIFDGDIVHWDSGGFKSTIHKGGIQWMTAGSGLIHSEQSSEKFKEEGGAVEIIQLWMNLPSDKKMTPPNYHGHEEEDLIHITDEEHRNTVHLISGEYNDNKGPVNSITGLTMMTVDINENGTFDIDIPEGHETLYYVVNGKVEVNGKEARMHDLVRFDRNSGTIHTEASENTKLILGYGKPFNEPIVAQGPFVMNTEREIMEAFQDYQDGKLGNLVKRLMKIYHSYELRWFAQKPFDKTTALFRDHGGTITPGAGRTDRYLVNQKNSFSLKIREGRLEIKIRGKSGEDIRNIGKPAFWTKWSYDLAAGDLKERFIEGDYLDVAKNRTLLYTQYAKPGFFDESPGDTGCQLEYGEIKVQETHFYTFGLEAFGEAPTTQMHSELTHALKLIHPVLEDLNGIQARDYPELLASLL